MKRLQLMVRVKRLNKIRKGEIHRRVMIEKTGAERRDKKVVRWFGHVDKINKERWPRKERRVEVEGSQGAKWHIFNGLHGAKETL